MPNGPFCVIYRNVHRRHAR